LTSSARFIYVPGIQSSFRKQDGDIFLTPLHTIECLVISLSLSLLTSKCLVLSFNKRSSRSVLLQGCRSDIYSYTQVKGSMAHHYAGVTSPEVEARS